MTPLTSHIAAWLIIICSTLIPVQTGDAAVSQMSRQQAYQILSSADTDAVQALPTGDREIMLAKLLIDQGKTDQAISVLNRDNLKQNQIAALMRAELYRRQSVEAAKRAGTYAHAITDDISKLKQSRFNGGLDAAEQRLTAFMSRNIQAPVRPVVLASTAQPVTRTKTANQIDPNQTTGTAPAAKPVQPREQAITANPVKTKTAKAEAPAAKPVSPLYSSALAAIEAWRSDWESGNADAYLSHYHPAFRTDKHDLQSWSAYKRRINSKKAYIHVRLSKLNLLRGPEKTAFGEAVLISFRQQYNSSNYNSGSNKQLYLVRKNNDTPWLILHEGTAQRPLPDFRTSASKPATRQQQKPWSVTLASFDSAERAQQMAAEITPAGTQHSYVSQALVNKHMIHRVLVGPYKRKSDAVKAMVDICPTMGLNDCWLIQQ